MIKILGYLLKGYWRGFVGGPDFNHNITRRFILEDKQLSINIPDSNIVVEPSTIKQYYPYSSVNWFNEHVEIYDQHKYVHVYTKNWMYMPPIALFPSSEYGMLSCQLRIKQTDKINVLDKHALACFVIQAYDDFHNGPEGVNTEIRETTTEQSSKMAVPFEPDELEEEISGWIQNRGMPPIPDALIKTFNHVDWVFYQEVRSNSFSRSDFYCLPLSENSFLEVEFRHRVDLSHKHKKWAKHALASQERIMASIYLDDLPQNPSLKQDNKHEQIVEPLPV